MYEAWASLVGLRIARVRDLFHEIDRSNILLHRCLVMFLRLASARRDRLEMSVDIRPCAGRNRVG